MAQIFTPSVAKQQPTRAEVTISKLDYQGVGIAHHQGRTLFIEGGLPTEKVQVTLSEQKKQYAHGRVTRILTRSEARIDPFCPYYGKCGGCSTQHITRQFEQEIKCQGVVELLQRLGKVTAPELEPLLQNEVAQNSRRACRLAIQFDKANCKVQLGFRRSQSTQLVEIESCAMLRPALSALLVPLREGLQHLKNPRDLGHIELAESDTGVVALLRYCGRLCDRDRNQLRQMAQEHNFSLKVKFDVGEVEVIHQAGECYYQLNGLKLHFKAGDFIQINRELNERMVAQALEWLNPQPNEKILDLFCGIGNFTLPLAQRAKEVVGVEGERTMVDRARYNAELNKIKNARFYLGDLSASIVDLPWAREGFDKVLLDPARPGAFDVLPHLIKLAPKAILYVSCNPVSLARDSGRLIEAGYQMRKLGGIDMFPHTGHIESMALFERK